ncbi:TetR/AcrR family transcriptional regulator [Myroides odoratimimus]|uniref:TetR/AcrR family transcriptional regulator n=1 Tax=Myroides odoratimimus TaxID=76832 RepID=UPI002577AAFB|nr:TetR/AcrR family transcriptional regulator [Myroides odoratimimus]MDM1395738.1 TetR/AcrR family transcriptional regulator [Myroides odoratimimus]MDM1528293.1 TetR/AcrR family transcriptional regulator [Myroides odoratimimus]
METQILEKATQMFLSQGFKTVTMDDIAAELSISKKTIYQHYASKPELIEKALASINAKFLITLEQTLKEGREAIPEILAAHDDINQTFLIDSSACFYQLTKYYPKLAQKQKIFHEKKYVRLIEQNLEKGIKEGVYRSEIDIDYVARFHIASLVAIEDLDYFPDSDYSHLEIHALHLEYHIRSIATEKGLKIFKELTQKNK